MEGNNLIIAILLASLIFSPLKNSEAAPSEKTYECASPNWNSPPESNDGVFTGDLTLECRINPEFESTVDISEVRKRIIEKVKNETSIYQGEDTLSSDFDLNLDVSHRLEEEGNAIQIRERVQISRASKTNLQYQTHSKEIMASGMAGYLRAVDFSMKLIRDAKGVSISFRNCVQVKRPWYALDLIFAPIARKICLEKLDKVTNKFISWIVNTTS